MSDVTELAAAEADRVEAEEAAAAAASEESPPAEPEPETAPEPTVDDAAIRKAERAISDQRSRLSKILGAEMVAHECPLCSALGYLPELPPPGAVLEVVETEDGVTFGIRSPGVPLDYEQAPDKGPCPECGALGEVKTGSKNPHAMTAPCSRCMGNGWVAVARDQQQNFGQVPSTAPAGVTQAANGAPIVADAWDRPFGHPHYGLPPSMVGVEGV